MTVKKFSWIIMGLMVLLAGCPDIGGSGSNDNSNGNNNNGNDNNKQPAKLSIANATALFIAPRGVNGSIRSARAVTDEKTVLYKVTETGAVEEVTWYELDDEGNEITVTETTTYEPETIHNVNAEYIIVCFNGGPGDCLVRKSDGAVFSLANTGRPTNTGGFWINQRLIFTDDAGGIYYTIAGSTVIKIDTTDLSNISSVQYSPAMDYIHYFAVDGVGNMLYRGMNSANGNYVNRLRKASGYVQNITMGYIDSSFNGTEGIWVGPDKCLYYFDESECNDSPYYTYVRKFNVTTGDIETFGSLPPIVVSEHSILQLQSPQKGYHYLISSDSRVLCVYSGDNIDVAAPEAVAPIELYPSIHRLPGLEFKTVIGVGISNQYYYIGGRIKNGDGVIKKYDFATDTPIEIYRGLEIYSFTVSSDDEVIFNAMRNEDGKKIVGKIDANCIVTIIEEASNFEINVLERIN